MRILGIDPGLATVGYGVIDYNGISMKLVDFGTINTPAGVALPRRLEMLYDSMTELCNMFSPDNIAFEELFFAKNVKTGINVAHARGVLVTAAYKYSKELFEYTPLQVKQAVTGYGNAEKQQIQIMVKTMMGLDFIPKPDDAADAVAIAICHAQSIKFKRAFKI